jgi:hypothetical protein
MKLSRLILTLTVCGIGVFAFAQPSISTEQLNEANKQEKSSITKDHLLIISARFDDPGLIATEAYLNEIGKSYKTLIATNETLTDDKLIDSSGKGLYEGVILTEGALSYNDKGSWKSAFDSEEWLRLWSYERRFSVRQVSLYTFPSNDPEDYGLRLVKPLNTAQTPLEAKFTPEGQTTLNNFNQTLNIKNAYTYLAKLEPSAGIKVSPLLIDSSGYILAVSSEQEGRERLAFTMAHSDFSEHTKQLLPGMVRWVSQTAVVNQTTSNKLFSPGLEKILIIDALIIIAVMLIAWLKRRQMVKRRIHRPKIQVLD